MSRPHRALPLKRNHIIIMLIASLFLFSGVLAVEQYFLSTAPAVLGVQSSK